MTSTGFSLQVKRSIKAPREKIFQAWTDLGKLKQWFAPEGVTCLGGDIDLRVGGGYTIRMVGPQKVEFSVSGKYLEIHKPEKISFTWDWDDPKMKVGETQVTIELNDLDGSTELILTHTRFQNEEPRDHHREGWESIVTNFKNYIESAS